MRADRRRPEAFVADLTEATFEDALAGWQPVEKPDEWLDRREARTQLAAAVRALDDDLRVVVVLLDIEGLSYREVAVMLDVPEGTVASRLFRARKALRGALDRGINQSDSPRPAHDESSRPARRVIQ